MVSSDLDKENFKIKKYCKWSIIIFIFGLILITISVGIYFFSSNLLEKKINKVNIKPFREKN